MANNGTVPAFPVNTFMLVPVIDYASDGTTVDNVEPLSVSVSAGAGVIDAIIDPTNNRRVKITGLAPGSGSVDVTAPGVPALNFARLLVTVSEAPNNSKVVMGPAADIIGPTPV